MCVCVCVCVCVWNTFSACFWINKVEKNANTVLHVCVQGSPLIVLRGYKAVHLLY